jgi:hypothetical protein
MAIPRLPAQPNEAYLLELGEDPDPPEVMEEAVHAKNRISNIVSRT